ncbi:hypothetical protein ORI20_08095 [Mycobacterium sp. CVI_P3]|uniref:Integral membrane protein n=1 Tax=Mycobacterium pinniadriaticum TaxID=2994102 RepID=A0ABT3SB15_9MYCO|nr:hypothetical protein [Mycobacterium pinniadriaticum]MCX2930232.1 hypothetical protein [Mycobacterium pinniadriaticum]MCX2936706.1 hypothetical protein [Mycobacterium pinniadriaticum]
MLTVPAFVWRGGALARAGMVGLGAGVFLGALAWLDSGMWFPALLVLVVVTLICGGWMGWWMARFWPGASALSGEQRARVAGVTHWGGRMGDPALAQPVVDFADGMHRSADSGRPFRWVLPLVLVLALGVAVWEVVAGSPRGLVASCLCLVLLGFVLFWWPDRRERLLANADRARDRALELIESTERKAG